MEEKTEKINMIEEEVTQSLEQENLDENKEITEFKNMPKTSIDIEKEKKQINSGNIDLKGNQAENLAIFQNPIINGGVSFGNFNVREILQNCSKIDKDYDLSDAKQYAEFGETVRAGEYFAIGVILCVFEYVELDDLQDLKSKLLEELPKVTDEEGKEMAIHHNSYLSINSMLKTIKGEMVVLESGECCVRLGVNRQIALKNLWQQFPEMRSYIARWLLKVYDSFEYRTNFNVAQITAAFVDIFKLDFRAGIKHFLPRLYSNSNKYLILGYIALELYNDIDYCDKILPYIIKWTESIDSWLWKSAIYVFANVKKGDEKDEFDKKIRKLITNLYNTFEYDSLRDEILPYIGVLLVGSERLRTLIACLFGEWMNNAYDYNERYKSCLWYLEFIRYGYYLVSYKITILPLVVCDKKEQLESLLPLLEIILLRYNSRQLFFATLESYIREISRYDVEKKIKNRIKAFFHRIIECNTYVYEDIVFFLKKCNCTLSKELLQYFQEITSLSTSMDNSIINVS